MQMSLQQLEIALNNAMKLGVQALSGNPYNMYETFYKEQN